MEDDTAAWQPSNKEAWGHRGDQSEGKGGSKGKGWPHGWDDGWKMEKGKGLGNSWDGDQRKGKGKGSWNPQRGSQGRGKGKGNWGKGSWGKDNWGKGNWGDRDGGKSKGSGKGQGGTWDDSRSGEGNSKGKGSSSSTEQGPPATHHHPMDSSGAQRASGGRNADFDQRWACFNCGVFNMPKAVRCQHCNRLQPPPGTTPDWRTMVPLRDQRGRLHTPRELALLFKAHIRSLRTITVHDFPENFKEEDLYNHWAEIGGSKAFDVRWIQMQDESNSYYSCFFRTPELATKAAAYGPPTFAGRQLRIQTHEDKMQRGKLRKRARQLLGGVDMTILNKGKKSKLRPVFWREKDLAENPFEKVFTQALHYDEHDGKKFQVYKEFYEGNVLSVLPHAVDPVLRWEEIDFGKEINDQVQLFSRPTPIQSLAWPVLLSGRDCIGLAKTGSGKTLAFLLPAIVHIRARGKTQVNDGPIVLILAPVRELVLQIAHEACRFKNAGFTTGEITGGHGLAGRLGQAEIIVGGVDMLVAAPKRLATFVECGILRLDRVSYMVLDEADRMLDMGFGPQINEVVSQLRPDRQTSMFTATWGQKVHLMALEYLKYDIAQIIACGGMEEVTMANPDVEQRFIYNLTDFDKTKELVKLVKQLKTEMEEQQQPFTRILIFCSRTRFVDDVCLALSAHWQNVYSLHSDLVQGAREANLVKFSTDPHAILVATDIAGRGLDIKNLPYIINYQMPQDILQYIHRIGRTARAGQKGVAISFLELHHRDLVPDLIKVLENVGQPVPSELLDLRDRPHLFYSSEMEAVPIFGHGTF